MWTHVCPLDVAAVADFATREQAGSGDYGSGCVYRLQVYPVEYLREIGTGLVGHHLKMHAKSYTHCLSVAVVDDLCYCGINTLGDTFIQHPREGDFSISRAHYKIQEAIERLSIPIENSWAVLDIGASPGGWTSYLQKHAGRVVAVDPAPLHETLTRSPKVIHIQKPLDESLHDLHALNSHFHIVCCDMNCTPSQIPGVLSRVLHMMHNGSYFIATLKFQHKPPSIAQPDVANAIADTVSALGFKEVKVVWLIANSCNERTLIAQKSA